MKYRSTIFLIISIFFFNTFVIHAQNLKPKTKEDLTKFIQKQLKKNNVQGLSIALVEGDKILWAEGFGFADVEKQTPATKKTVYRVGSISKLFVATAVMQLHEKGKLNINDPVKKYIKNFNPKSRFGSTDNITIRSLLTHHSGLPSDVFDRFFDEKVPPFQSIIDYLNEEYVCTPPNTIMSYSNAAYSVLGVLIEEVSGEDFLQYTDKLLADMDMDLSTFKMNKKVNKYFSKGYMGKGKLLDEGLVRDLPAGMLHSNVIDMSHFITTVLNKGKYKKKEILKAKTLAEMHKRQNKKVDLDFSREIGLSWFLDNKKWKYAGGMVEHGGDTQTFHAQLNILPKRNIGAIVLTNSEGGISASRTICNELIEKALIDLKGQKRPEAEKQEKIKLRPGKIKNLKKYAGTYAISGPILADFKEKKGRLETKVMGYKIQLVPNSNRTFTPKIKIAFIGFPQKNEQLVFEKTDDTYIIKSITKTRTSLFAQKVKKTPPNKVWKDRIGSYEILNNDDNNNSDIFKEFELVEQDNSLTLKVIAFGESQALPIGLNIVSNTEAIVHGLGRNTGNTISVYEKDGKEILRFAGIELVKK